MSFTAVVQDEMGYALGLAQLGAKPWKGEGPGILEMVEDFRGDTYRAVYAVRFAEVVYPTVSGLKWTRLDTAERKLLERKKTAPIRSS